jgi:hypothetical protein
MPQVSLPWLLLAVVPFGIAIRYAMKYKSRPEISCVSEEMLRNYASKTTTESGRHWTFVCGLLASIVLVFGVSCTGFAAQKVKTPDVPLSTSACVIVADVSKTMTGIDVGNTDDRLTIMKKDLKTAVTTNRGCTLMALVSFGARAQGVVPLTDNTEKLIKAINNLDIIVGGTVIGEGIALAVNACSFSSYPCTIFLVGDGEDNPTGKQLTLEEGLKLAVDSKATVHTVNYGSQLAVSKSGEIFRSKPGGAQAFQNIAGATGGKNLSATSPGELAAALASVKPVVTMIPGGTIVVPGKSLKYLRIGYGVTLFFIVLVMMGIVRDFQPIRHKVLQPTSAASM